MKITKFKIFMKGEKVAEGNFSENEELTREKLEKINILTVHFEFSEKRGVSKKDILQSLVMNGFDEEIENIKKFFDYKVIFEDEKDFEKDKIEAANNDFLKEKLKSLIDKFL